MTRWIVLLVIAAAAMAGCSGADDPLAGKDEPAAENEDEIRASDDAFLVRVANAGGEYFDLEGTPYAANVSPIALSALSQTWQSAIERERARETAERDPELEPYVTDDRLTKISRANRVVGYHVVLQHEDSDCGLRLFMNARKKVVKRMEWCA
jgi:hypothetical protein